jgi:outer membrane protein OmpA-like peptidoglycan-associated protein
MALPRPLLFACTTTALLCAAALRALPASAEPVLVSLEGAGGVALSSPQINRFGPGVFGAVGVAYPLLPQLLIGGRLRAGFLADGAAPPDPGVQDPGLGTLESLTLSLRFRPLAQLDGPARSTGLFLEAAGGGGVTGQLTRATFDLGLGYGFGLGAATLAPVLRYAQVVQPSQVLSDADARLLMLGAEVTFFDARELSAVAEPEPTTASDLDHDGIGDAHDACADQPEDLDGYQDDDGCPEADNDGDKLLDVSDQCPDAAEDFDTHLDDDGCPEPDNDDDGFLDVDDQCVNEAEVVNGNKDYDGCPDEGLFVFKNDRIVLEERVLFDFERARVKREAKPLLRAIVNLKAQHPEWIKLRVEGHADASGEERFNQELSERRANNVMRELIRLGIPASQIEFTGFGSSRPRDRREDDEANARNRRVEFVVVARGVAPAPDPAAAPPLPAASDDDQDPEPEVEPPPAAPAPVPTTPTAPAAATGSEVKP